MSPVLQLLFTAIVSLLLSTAVLRSLTTPLSRVLERVCPDPDAAAFWLRYTQIMLTLAPMLVATLVDMFTTASQPFEAFRLTLVAALAGLLLGLSAIGRRLKPFVKIPGPGNPL